MPPLAPPARPAHRAAKLALVVLVALGLGAAWRTGLLDLFAEPARLKQALLHLGPWGWVAFVAAYTALQPFGVPGTVFVLAAPLIWPWPVAFGLSMVGTMAASVVGFSFARFVARDWVAQRIPARLHAYDEALARHGFLTVVGLRFVLWMPQVLHTFLGLSRVGFWTHFWGSLVGYIVPLLLTSYFGAKLWDVARDAPPAVWIGLGLGTVVLGVAVWLVRRRGRTEVP